MILNCNEDLATSAPFPGNFAVTVAGSPRSVNAVNLGGREVRLPLASAIMHGQSVTVGYTEPDLSSVPEQRRQRGGKFHRRGGEQSRATTDDGQWK